MTLINTLRVLAAALPLASVSLPALADIKDYEFRLVQNEIKQGNGVVVAVTLIDKRSGKPVPDAEKEIRFGVEVIRYYAEEGRRIGGDIRASSRADLRRA